MYEDPTTERNEQALCHSGKLPFNEQKSCTDPGSEVGGYLMGQREQERERWTEIGTDRERK